jgi:hypothetical protein
MGAARACDFFGSAGGDDTAAVFASFGAEVDDVVGALDDVEIVFDHQNRVAERDQAL